MSDEEALRPLVSSATVATMADKALAVCVLLFVLAYPAVLGVAKYVKLPVNSLSHTTSIPSPNMDSIGILQ